MKASELKDRANGRWVEILTSAGIDAKYLRDKHGPCPGCGGTDRFRFDDKNGRGTWICGGGSLAQQESGAGLDLLMHCHGLTFKEAKNKLADILGINDESSIANINDYKRRTINRSYDTAKSIYEQAIWEAEKVCNHPYAIKKGVGIRGGAGLGSYLGEPCIVVPIYRVNTYDALQGVQVLFGKQVMNPKSGKLSDRYSHGNVKDGWLCLGSPKAERLIIFEGWASGVRWFQAFPHDCVAICFGLNHQENIAEKVDHNNVIIAEEQ